MSKEKETKTTRFHRLAESRMNKAMKSIRSIASLSNKNNYNYTDEEVHKMVKTLKREIADLENAFKQNGSGEADFKF
jgi:hypothetical protein